MKRIQKINIHQAKTHLSRFLQETMKGQEFIIANGKIPVARLIPFRENQPIRNLGRDQGKIRIDPSFNDPIDPETFE